MGKSEMNIGTRATLRCWPGILLFVSVGIVCFVQNEILGGMGWMLAAMWLFFFNVECVFFNILMGEVRKMQKEDGKDI